MMVSKPSPKLESKQHIHSFYKSHGRFRFRHTKDDCLPSLMIHLLLLLIHITLLFPRTDAGLECPLWCLWGHSSVEAMNI